MELQPVAVLQQEEQDWVAVARRAAVAVGLQQPSLQEEDVQPSLVPLSDLQQTVELGHREE